MKPTITVKDDITGGLIITPFLLVVAYEVEILSVAMPVSLGALALTLFTTLYVKRDLGIAYASKTAAIAGWVALLAMALFGVLTWSP